MSSTFCREEIIIHGIQRAIKINRKTIITSTEEKAQIRLLFVKKKKNINNIFYQNSGVYSCEIYHTF